VRAPFSSRPSAPGCVCAHTLTDNPSPPSSMCTLAFYVLTTQTQNKQHTTLRTQRGRGGKAHGESKREGATANPGEIQSASARQRSPGRKWPDTALQRHQLEGKPATATSLPPQKKNTTHTSSSPLHVTAPTCLPRHTNTSAPQNGRPRAPRPRGTYPPRYGAPR
jgi:hypothetical protein